MVLTIIIVIIIVIKKNKKSENSKEVEEENKNKDNIEMQSKPSLKLDQNSKEKVLPEEKEIIMEKKASEGIEIKNLSNNPYDKSILDDDKSDLEKTNEISSRQLIDHIKNQKPKSYEKALKLFSQKLNNNEIAEFNIAEEIRKQNQLSFINPNENSHLNDLNDINSHKSKSSKVSARITAAKINQIEALCFTNEHRSIDEEDSVYEDEDNINNAQQERLEIEKEMKEAKIREEQLQKEIRRKLEEYKNGQLMNAMKEDAIFDKNENPNLPRSSMIVNNDFAVKEQNIITDFSKEIKNSRVEIYRNFSINKKIEEKH